MDEHAERPWHETVSIPAMLRLARQAYGGAMRRALAATGCDDVPVNGLWVIGALALGEGPVPISGLLSDLRLPEQVAAQLVDRLVSAGYIERSVDPADPGRIEVALTNRGRIAARAQAAGRERIDARLLATVGEADVAAMRRGLAALTDIVREAGDRAAS